MQDWNYLNTNCFEVTIELGCVKYPPAKDLPSYWEQNRRALLQFIHQVKTTRPWTSSSLLEVLHLLVYMWLCVSAGSQWSDGHSVRQ